jgi:hypothetical protein
MLKSSMKLQGADFAFPMQQAARPEYVAPNAYSGLPLPVAATSPANDLAPLPSTMLDRESSMFRFLKHTHLLPTLSASASSAFAFDTQPLKLPPKSRRTSEELTVYPAPPSTTAMPHPPPSEGNAVPALPKYSEFSTDTASASARYAGLPQQQRQQEQAYEQHQPHHYHQQHGNVPSLTRFTSQVSDWLNSFWPTDHQNTGRQASVQQVHDTAARMAPPPRDNLPQDKTLPATSMTSVVPIKLCTTSASRKRKSQSSLPRLPYSVSGGVNNCDDNVNPYQIPLAAMPSELEQSVSATLLKLAGSPSRLFSGLTSFFGEAGVSAAVAPQPSRQPHWQDEETKASASASAGSSKKSQNSLLDDYEESPMEARLRSLQYA